MDSAHENELPTHQNVNIWLETAKFFCPEITIELKYATEIRKMGVTAAWPAPVRKFLVSFRLLLESRLPLRCRLPMPNFETGLRSHAT